MGLEVNWAYGSRNLQTLALVIAYGKGTISREPSSFIQKWESCRMSSLFPFWWVGGGGKQVPWILNTAVTPREVYMREHNWGENGKKVKTKQRCLKNVKKYTKPSIEKSDVSSLTSLLDVQMRYRTSKLLHEEVARSTAKFLEVPLKYIEVPQNTQNRFDIWLLNCCKS